MKSIKLTHGSATVSEDIPKEAVKALNKLSEIIFNAVEHLEKEQWEKSRSNAYKPKYK